MRGAARGGPAGRRRCRGDSGYVDLAQVAFHRPAPSAAVTAANLAALRRVHADAGARVLVVSGRSALPVPDATTCWLQASRESLVERLLARGRGEGPAIPGDDLRGRPAAELRALAVEVPVPQAADVVVDTDGRTADEVIETVRARG